MLKAKPSKSSSLYQGTGCAYSPQLSTGSEITQHINNSAFKFLGMHIRIPPNPVAAKITVRVVVQLMLKAIDKVPVTVHQKLRLYIQTGYVPLSFMTVPWGGSSCLFFKLCEPACCYRILKEVVRACSIGQPFSFVPVLPSRRSGAPLSDCALQEAASFPPHSAPVLTGPCSVRCRSSVAADPEEHGAADLQACQNSSVSVGSKFILEPESAIQICKSHRGRGRAVRV